jgi:hypothetical protein
MSLTRAIRPAQAACSHPVSVGRGSEPVGFRCSARAGVITAKDDGRLVSRALPPSGA